MVAKDRQHMSYTPASQLRDRDVHLPVINVPVRSKTPIHLLPLRNSRVTPGREPTSRISNSRSLETRERRDMPPQALQREKQFELECDYDTSATTLYELLESSSFEKARSRCRSHPEEVRTWIVRKDKSNAVRWKLLPLHAAIIFQSPSFVVAALLERYPAAASRKDDQGMLPLHLAFRHKQEDEELLELLLLEYPKAVLQRDRRDRTPLEHGRESQFSAKLMKLYAESTVTASKALANQHGKSDQMTYTTAPTEITQSISISQFARLEKEHEAKLLIVRTDYDYQIEQLKTKYEDRILGLKEDMAEGLRQAEKTAHDDRRAARTHHEQEISELKDTLKRQVSKDREIIDSLQKDVNHLEAALQQAKHQEESMAEKYGKLVTINVQLREFLEHVCQEQATIQEMAQKQHQHLEAARAIRTELVKTLLKQEDMDDQNERLKGSKVMEIANRVQRNVTDYIEHKLVVTNDGNELELHKVERKGPSRIDMERAEGEILSSGPDGQTEVQVAAYRYYAEEEEGDQKKSLTKERESRSRHEEGDFPEVEILGDEISAITENSAY
jgi:ankyrin repeat protein